MIKFAPYRDGHVVETDDLTVAEILDCCTTDQDNWAGHVEVTSDGVVKVTDDDGWTIYPFDSRYQDCLLSGLARRLFEPQS